jgi:hypothetical protein
MDIDAFLLGFCGAQTFVKFSVEGNPFDGAIFLGLTVYFAHAMGVL